MRAVRLLLLCAGLLVSGQISRGDELPPAAKEVLDAFAKESTEVYVKAEEAVKKAGEKVIVELKLLLDKFCKEAKLDEAIAIRDHIRQLQGGAANANAANLPSAAKEVLEAHEKEAAEIKARIVDTLKKSGEKTERELKKIQDQFCKEAKLDEALAVREARRRLHIGATNAKADPGYFSAGADEIGKVYYFEVIGNANGSTWGTDVYTTDSNLATTTVHAGVLAVGQKGVVKVTVLPGQNNYPSTMRNGVTSSSWGAWGVSFKVERVFAAVVERPKE